MKLLLKEYVASLRERDELDKLLPDLVSELGWHVFSRPAVGIRQLGVDMAACGKDDDGQKKVFLFSIKPGNLKRADWDGSVQALRSSLNEIVDSYVSQRLPQKYKDLPVVVCICVGGEIDQSVEPDVRAYCEQTTKRTGVTFQEWNGDTIANLLLSGVLREHVLPQTSRSLFQKSVATLDEPDASFDYFKALLAKLLPSTTAAPGVQLGALRRVSICLWVLYVWAREADNLEAPFRASELAVLRAWPLVAPRVESKSKTAKEMRLAIDSLLELHLQISNSFLDKIRPHARKMHALSTGVRSSRSVDINLRMFEIVGRIALFGLWLLHMRDRVKRSKAGADVKFYDQQILRGRNTIKATIKSNPILLSPIKDDHAIEVSLIGLFLTSCGDRGFVRAWVDQITAASVFAFKVDAAYPTIYTDYQDLAAHPVRTDEYRQAATAGSVLYPTLLIWAKFLGDLKTVDAISRFCAEDIPHCAVQLWVLGPESEQHLYDHSFSHGQALMPLPITADGEALVQLVLAESRTNKNFDSLSVVRAGMWPVVLMACRHYRLPVPLDFWRMAGYLEDPDVVPEDSTDDVPTD